MKRLTLLVLAACVAGITPLQFSLASSLTAVLEREGARLVKQAKLAEPDARSAYVRYVDLVAARLVKLGDRPAAARIRNAMMDPEAPDFPRTDIAWLTHIFAREFYKDSIIARTAELVRFKTIAAGPVPNRENPEFLKLRDFLRQLAGDSA